MGGSLQFLVINKNKIKISLNADDLKKYSLTECLADSEGYSAKRSFYKILLKARESVDFDVSGYRLLIQFYPIADGAELFVTRLNGFPEGKERALSSSPNVTLISPQISVYLFSGLENLSAALRAICGNASSIECELYYIEGEGYYLIAQDKIGISRDFSPFLEYSEERSPALAPYIKEHALKIADTGQIALISEL
jgi:negative regulator of genetic competence, sporulation and motility